MEYQGLMNIEAYQIESVHHHLALGEMELFFKKEKESIKVKMGFVNQFKPKADGYYIVMCDGSETYLSRADFLEQFTPIPTESSTIEVFPVKNKFAAGITTYFKGVKYDFTLTEEFETSHTAHRAGLSYLSKKQDIDLAKELKELRHFKDTHVGLYAMDKSAEQVAQSYIDAETSITVAEDVTITKFKKLLNLFLVRIAPIVLCILMSLNLSAQTFTLEEVEIKHTNPKHEDKVTLFDALNFIRIDTTARTIKLIEAGTTHMFRISDIFVNNDKMILLTRQQTPTWFSLENGNISLMMKRKKYLVTRKFIK